VFNLTLCFNSCLAQKTLSKIEGISYSVRKVQIGRASISAVQSDTRCLWETPTHEEWKPVQTGVDRRKPLDSCFDLGVDEDDARYRARSSVLPRKEVIQPHLPVRLPCYDFTPITDPTLDACLSEELAQRLQGLPTFVV
jgi:hypothetical protein